MRAGGVILGWRWVRRYPSQPNRHHQGPCSPCSLGYPHPGRQALIAWRLVSEETVMRARFPPLACLASHPHPRAHHCLPTKGCACVCAHTHTHTLGLCRCLFRGLMLAY